MKRPKGRRLARLRAVIVGVLTASALSACAAARQVVILPDGGVIAVASRSEANMLKAVELIRPHCPGGYEITLQEEVPVGSRYKEETTYEQDRKDRVTSKTEYTVRTKYEWRIHYSCR